MNEVTHKFHRRENTYETYKNPRTLDYEDIPGKTFVFKINHPNFEDGVGVCKVTFFNRPMKFFLVNNIDVYPGAQGNKFGTYIRETLFDYFDKKGIPAILNNIADFNFYEQNDEGTRRRVWKRIKEHDGKRLLYVPDSAILTDKDKEFLYHVAK